ncbi:ficolin-1 [Elysia marginata]|uniref:Ficolin-1 n=1 Tax=Elysia marginata TaxID=1093978 RepID=A0AAV4G253_9GAST|nr:ficolin-1 [Elysia marginata]
MKRTLFVIAFLCFVACHGLDLRFDREYPRVRGTRNTCGVLTCEEEINASNSSVSDKDQADPNVALNSILSLFVFKRRGSSIYDDTNDKRGVLLGSLTAQSPTITRISNGRKVDGLLQAGRAKLRVELVKREDCSAEFVCQVKGLDSQGREVVSTTNLVQRQSQDGYHSYDRNSMPAMSMQILTMVQQLTQSINGLENRIEDKMLSLEKSVRDEKSSLEEKIEDKISSLENNVENKISSLANKVDNEISSLEEKVEDKISHQQTDIATKIDTFEYRLNTKLDLLENRVESKIDNYGNLNKLMDLDSTVTRKQTDCRPEAKADISADALDLMWQKFFREQKIALKNIAQSFQTTQNGSCSLIALNGDLNLVKSYGQMILNETEAIRTLLTSGVPSQCGSEKDQLVLNQSEAIRKLLTSKQPSQCVSEKDQLILNETAAIRKLLTSEVPSRCVSEKATDPPKLHSQLVECKRDMGKHLNQSYPQYVTMSQFTLKRQILCDTKTDGGGWIVIQRRVNGKVYFNRDWESYKKGFGKPEPDEDFWLGNDAIYVLTYLQPYELRVEFRSQGKDYVAKYKTFKLEDEADKWVVLYGEKYLTIPE